VEGAFGRFSYKFYPYKKQVWIAGGIGVTPFVSLAKSLDIHKEFIIDFYYSVKNIEEAVYRDLFQNISRDNPHFRFHLRLSKDKGRLTAEEIINEVKDLSEREIFICGPTVLMVSMKK
jgi:predicted ferric reductase